MEPPMTSLENQRVLVVRENFSEIHPLLSWPGYWSGHGWHLDFKSGGSYRQFLFPEKRCLGMGDDTTILETSYKEIPIALKIFRWDPTINHADFLKEARRLAFVEHRHLILTLGTFLERDLRIGILLYPLAACSLENFLDELSDTRDDPYQATQLSERFEDLKIEHGDEGPRLEAYRYLQRSYGCLSQALEYLHNRGISHGELSPHHILLSSKGPCITDFGLQKPLRGHDPKPEIYRYCAPESSGTTPPTLAGDIFALGCCFLEISTVVLDRPLAEVRDLAKTGWHDSQPAYKNSINHLQDWLTEIEQKQARDGREFHDSDLIRLMVRKELERRPDAAKIVFYLECLEGQNVDSTSGRLFHHDCCRPRKFEIAENKELQKSVEGLRRVEPIQYHGPKVFRDARRGPKEDAGDKDPTVDHLLTQPTKTYRDSPTPRAPQDTKIFNDFDPPDRQFNQESASPPLPPRPRYRPELQQTQDREQLEQSQSSQVPRSQQDFKQVTKKMEGFDPSGRQFQPEPATAPAPPPRPRYPPESRQTHNYEPPKESHISQVSRSPQVFNQDPSHPENQRYDQSSSYSPHEVYNHREAAGQEQNFQVPTRPPFQPTTNLPDPHDSTNITEDHRQYYRQDPVETHRPLQDVQDTEMPTIPRDSTPRPTEGPPPYSTPEPKYICPFAQCIANSSSVDDFYDHLSDTHKFTLSNAYKYVCSRCSELAPMPLDSLQQHLLRHAPVEQEALFNKSVYTVLKQQNANLQRKVLMGSIGNKFSLIT